MKLLLVAFVLSCVVYTVVQADDRCSYNFCYKEELTGCEKQGEKDREACNRRGGLFITYREGLLSGSKHKCCMWRMADIPNKNLYCVRNIRSSSQLCTSKSVDDYTVKVKSKNSCNKFACQ